MLNHIVVISVALLIVAAVVLWPRPPQQQKCVVSLVSGVHALSRGDLIMLIEDAQGALIDIHFCRNQHEWIAANESTLRTIGSDLARFIMSHPQSGKFESIADSWASSRLFAGPDTVIDIPVYNVVRNLQIIKLLLAELPDVDFVSALDLRWAQTLYLLNHEKPVLVGPPQLQVPQPRGETSMEEETRMPSTAPRMRKLSRSAVDRSPNDDRLEKCSLPQRSRPNKLPDSIIDYGDLDQLRRKIRGGVPDPTKTKTLAHDYDYLEDIWQPTSSAS